MQRASNRKKLPVSFVIYALIQFANWVSYASVFKLLIGTGVMNVALYGAALAAVRAAGSFFAGRGYLAKINYYPWLLGFVALATVPQIIAIEKGWTIPFLILTSVKIGSLAVFQVWRDILGGKIARLGVSRAHKFNSVVSIVDFVTLGGGCLLGGALASLIDPANVIWFDIPLYASALVMLLRIPTGRFATMIEVRKLSKPTGWRPVVFVSHALRSISDAGFQAALPIVAYKQIGVSPVVFSISVAMSAFFIAFGAKLAVLFASEKHFGRAKYASVALYSTIINALTLWLCFTSKNIWLLDFWLILASLASGVATVAGRTIFISELHLATKREFDGALYFTLVRWAGVAVGSLLFALGILVVPVSTITAIFLLVMALSGVTLWLGAFERGKVLLSVGKKTNEVLFFTFLLLLAVACGVSYVLLFEFSGKRRLEVQYSSLVPYATLVEMNVRVSDLSEIIRLNRTYKFSSEVTKIELQNGQGETLLEEEFSKMPKVNAFEIRIWEALVLNDLGEKWQVAESGFLFNRTYQFSYGMKGLGPNSSDLSLVVSVDGRGGIIQDLKRTLTTILIFFVFLTAVFLFLRNLFRQLLKPLADVSHHLDSAKKNSDTRNLILCPEELVGSSLEVQKVVRGYNDLLVRTSELHQQLAKSETEQKLGQLASQVAHDIRSPLSALNMVMGQLKDIPEAQRIMIRNSVNRIQDIANVLLQKSKEQKGTSSSVSKTDVEKPLDMRVELLPALVENLVSEKRIQFRGKIGIEIEWDLNNSYGAFVNINPTELKRIISNLVNNSAEALPDSKGRIIVDVKNKMSEIVLAVKDNGKGIPKHVLEKLGERGVTHGKEGTQSGSGLGVWHAKTTIETFGGKFEITSVDGFGTTTTMTFAAAPPQKWFVEKLVLNPTSEILSLDDDVSIHGIWKGRFLSLKIQDHGIKHLTFTSGPEFKLWFHENGGLSGNARRLYLVDYELLNQMNTGLEIIEELGIGPQAILVTSRYEEPAIRDRCDRLGVKLIPKAMAGFVPMEIEKPKELLDLILIDDDVLIIHSFWHSTAEMKGKKIKTFATPSEFYMAAPSIDQQTPIYIDVSLGNGVKGQAVAVEVHKLGFKKIHLATGYEPDAIEKPEFIISVCRKDFPI